MFKLPLVGSLLAFSFIAVSPVNANEVAVNQSSENYEVSPRELVSLARHGRFREQGIPSHDNFRSRVRSGKITATDLVQSAIANNRLSPEVASDRQYLNAVTNHLKSGGCGS